MPLTLSLSPHAGRGYEAEAATNVSQAILGKRRGSPSPRWRGEGRGEGHLTDDDPESASSAPPLTLAELAAVRAALGGFEAQPAIAVAVSGGPDSLALILLAERWARQRGGQAW